MATGPLVPVPAKLYAGWAGARLFEPGYQQECGFDGPAFTCREALSAADVPRRFLAP